MNQTPNYQLNQWEKTDRIRMEDFNADNAKIEAALELLGTDKYYLGSWTGDGTANRVIQLPFAPSFILVLGVYYSGSGSYSPLITLATQETQRCIDNTSAHYQNKDIGGILSGSTFQLGGNPPYNNAKGVVVHYLALK